MVFHDFIDEEGLGFQKLQQALKQIEIKYHGVQWEVNAIHVAEDARLSTLYAFKGTVMSLGVSVVAVDALDEVCRWDPDDEEQLVQTFPRAAVNWIDGEELFEGEDSDSFHDYGYYDDVSEYGYNDSDGSYSSD